MRYTRSVRVRSPDPEHLKLLMRYAPAIQQMALAAREMILEEAPEASEFVYEVYTIADHFTFYRAAGWSVRIHDGTFQLGESRV